MLTSRSVPAIAPPMPNAASVGQVAGLACGPLAAGEHGVGERDRHAEDDDRVLEVDEHRRDRDGDDRQAHAGHRLDDRADDDGGDHDQQLGRGHLVVGPVIPVGCRTGAAAPYGGRMRIGMSLSSTSTLPARQAAAHLLARVRATRDAGLDTLTFGDSHGRSTVRYFQNVPTLGAGARRVGPGAARRMPVPGPDVVAGADGRADRDARRVPRRAVHRPDRAGRGARAVRRARHALPAPRRGAGGGGRDRERAVRRGDRVERALRDRGRGDRPRAARRRQLVDGHDGADRASSAPPASAPPGTPRTARRWRCCPSCSASTERRARRRDDPSVALRRDAIVSDDGDRARAAARRSWPGGTGA